MGPIRKSLENTNDKNNTTHKRKHRSCLAQLAQVSLVQRNLKANPSCSTLASRRSLELVKQKLDEDDPFLNPLEGEHQQRKRKVREAYSAILNKVEAETLSLEMKPHFRTWFQESSHRLQDISMELANLELEQDLKGLELHHNSSPSKLENRIEANLRIWTCIKPRVVQAVASSDQITAALCPNFTSILCIWVKITGANRKLVDWLEDVDKLLWFHDSDFGFKTARKFLLEIAEFFQLHADLLQSE
ncbi:unnamed protein product [Orchesella dallaii]|uniref:Uncharacterized protein n=1 Tax=Orchesella dallaii TaxID=48710 RepID=A0ABP1S3X5_9HEXA